jgi:hypothetical protein
MLLRRVRAVAGRLLILALAALIIPACKKTEETDPRIKKATPDFAAIGASHFPLMVIEWDRALEPATVNTTNIKIYTTDSLGVIQGAWAQPYSVEYIPGTFQTVIKNGVAMGDGTTLSYWAILIFPGLTSDKGVPANVLPSGSAALWFQVGTNANLVQPSPSTPGQVVGGISGQIVFNWAQATEGGNPIVGESYTFYGSTASGDQDFLDLSPHLVVNDNGTGTVSGLIPNTLYRFRLVVRDAAGNIAIVDEFSGTSNP